MCQYSEITFGRPKCIGIYYGHFLLDIFMQKLTSRVFRIKREACAEPSDTKFREILETQNAKIR